MVKEFSATKQNFTYCSANYKLSVYNSRPPLVTYVW